MRNLDPDRLFPVDPSTRNIARELFSEVANLPLISPHGHTDPRWFAQNETSPTRPSCSLHRITMFSECCSLKALA